MRAVGAKVCESHKGDWAFRKWNRPDCSNGRRVCHLALQGQLDSLAASHLPLGLRSQTPVPLSLANGLMGY
jgi:hypothetical protein